MALTEENIRIIIAAELKKQGFKDAENATKRLSTNFKKLGAVIGVALSARAFINFSKSSIQAFAKEEQAVKQLTTSLGNLGFSYNVPAIENFLEATEQATLVTKDQLRPAIVDLIGATMDSQLSMTLLAQAIDISVATGTDLTSVSTALTRAFNGNFASLGKLQTRYTSTELEALGFEAAVAALNEEFKGAAAANLDSYSGKLASLQIAADKAKEEVGKGLVKAIEQLGSGDYDQGLQDLVDSGRAIGDAFQYAASAVQTLKSAYDIITLRGVRTFTENLLGKGQQTRGGSITPTQFELAKANAERTKDLVLQRKILAERKKAFALTEKEKKNQLALNKAKAVFDIEKIQIEAALQGKITEEERTRLLLMKAILAEDVGTATKLADKLEKIQEQTVKLAESLTDLKAGNPFSEWDGYFDAAKNNIKDLFDTLAKQQMALNELMTGIATSRATANANVIAAKTDKATAFKEAAEASGVFAGLSSADAAAAVVAAAEAVAAATTPEEKAAAQEAVDAANAYVDATSLLTESLAAADLAAALASLELANEYLNQSIEAATSQGIIPETTINVTVEGNVTSAEDLAEVITDIQYNYQRTGKGLLLSSRQI
jgi:hypothetical protein